MRGIVKGIAGVAGVGIAAFAGTSAIDDNTTRNEAGEIIESGGLGAFQMRIGDCFNDPTDLEAELVASVEGVPCTGPHDNEVFTEFDVSYPSFPGDQALYDDAWVDCVNDFEAYVGVPYSDSVLDVAAFTPSSESWAQDDREVTCFVYHWQGQKLTVSTRASGL